VGLFSRSGGAVVTVTPEVVVPRQTIQATVTTDKPIDKVSSARLDWGYTNFYRYHWAGRVDSAAAAGNDTVWTADQAGTNYGGDRDTDDWVSVIVEDVPIATGQFTGAFTPVEGCGSAGIHRYPSCPGSVEDTVAGRPRSPADAGSESVARPPCPPILSLPLIREPVWPTIASKSKTSVVRESCDRSEPCWSRDSGRGCCSWD